MLPIQVPRLGSNGWMPSKPQRIEVVLETLVESITLAEEVGVRVAAAAGFDEDDQYKIGLAVHEAVMNAFQYGNEQQRERKITSCSNCSRKIGDPRDRPGNRISARRCSRSPRG